MILRLNVGNHIAALQDQIEKARKETSRHTEKDEEVPCEVGGTMTLFPWPITTLKVATSFLKDGTHFSPTSKTGPFRYLTSKNIRAGYMDLSDCCFISEADHRRIFESCPVQEGDILLTKDGASVGNACRNPLNEEFSLLSSVVYSTTSSCSSSSSALPGRKPSVPKLPDKPSRESLLPRSASCESRFRLSKNNTPLRRS